MKKIAKITSWLVIIAIVVSFGQALMIPTVNAVGVTAPIFTNVVSGSKPYITCTASVGSEVMVYIDKVFAGMAKFGGINNNKSTFIYYYSSNLSSGKHNVTLIARDRTSLLMSDVSEVREIIIPDLMAPRLYQPTEKTITANRKIAIEGSTLSGTVVHIYIDGVYNGKTKQLNDYSGVAKFKYVPYLNLSLGWHSAYAIAENLADGKSLTSNTINFNIEKPMTAPVLKSAQIVGGKLKVSGLTKSSSVVRIYVDNKVYAQVKSGYSKTGTSGFYYNGTKLMGDGIHQVKITALDWRGKESLSSKVISTNRVYTYERPVITPSAAKEKNEVTKKIDDKMDLQKVDSDHDGLSNFDELNMYHTNPFKADTDGDSYNDKTEIEHGFNPTVAAGKKVDEKMDESKKNENEEVRPITETQNIETTTSANEESESVEDMVRNALQLEEKKIDSATTATSTAITSNSSNKKFAINLAIFLVFLVGIIAWILWVNKELIKEKTRQESDVDVKERDNSIE